MSLKNQRKNIPLGLLNSLEDCLNLVHEAGYNSTDLAFDSLQALMEGRGTKRDLREIKKAIDNFVCVDFGVESFLKTGFDRDKINRIIKSVHDHLS